MRLYLDACCWNRPFDDQSQLRVHLESVAVLAIGEGAELGRWTLLSSEALELELTQIPDVQRRTHTRRLLLAARERIAIGPSEIARADALQRTLGLSEFDALHLACAEALHADVFLTTDDRLLRACGRMARGETPLVITNPLAWLTDFLGSE